MSSEHHTIQYLSHQLVDKKKWDECIAASPNGLVYGYSFYLDHMAGNWDALVITESSDQGVIYQTVMPLPWRKKFGIHYLYYPFLTAQLGVFGKNISAEVVENFLDAIPAKFRLWDFPLNYQNIFPIENYPVYLRSNFVLPLNKAYEELYQNFSDNVKRNLKKSKASGNYCEAGIEVEKVIQLARSQTKGESELSFKRFENLYNYLHIQGMAKVYGIFSAENQLIASAVFFFSHKRAYYILVGNHPNGRRLGASHALIDQFIHDHAGRELTLDFEGSDINGLAGFYSSFGAGDEKYAAIRLNRLPSWLRWLKK